MKSSNPRQASAGAMHRAWGDVSKAAELLGRAGLHSLLKHSMAVAQVRLHHAVCDRLLHARLPRRLARQVSSNDLSLTVSDENEREGVVPSSAVPSQVLKWAVEGLSIDPAEYAFVDIGSGHGYALLVAARWPFRRLVGVEFAHELHQMAVDNVEWSRENGWLASKIELRNESALVTELPPDPLVLLLYNPFSAWVLERFLDHVDRSARDHPRDVLILYVNPRQREVLDLSTAYAPVALRGRQRLMLGCFSPFSVLAYRWRVPDVAPDRRRLSSSVRAVAT